MFLRILSSLLFLAEFLQPLQWYRIEKEKSDRDETCDDCGCFRSNEVHSSYFIYIYILVALQKSEDIDESGLNFRNSVFSEMSEM